MGVMAYKAHGKYSRVLYVILPLPVKLSPPFKSDKLQFVARFRQGKACRARQTVVGREWNAEQCPESTQAIPTQI